MTALLCYACRIIDESLGLHKTSQELQDWFDDHDLQDRRRLKIEADAAAEAIAAKEKERYLESIRERLRDQLSPEEKEAIGWDA